MMLSRHRLLWGLALILALPAVSMAQAVTLVNGVPLDTDKIRWDWDFISGETYVIKNSVSGVTLATGLTDNTFTQTLTNPNFGNELPTNTTMSVLVGTVVQSPLAASGTYYSLAEKPRLPVGTKYDSLTSRGFRIGFNSGTNNTSVRFRSQAVSTQDGAIITPAEVTNVAPATDAWILLNSGLPNTEYTVSVKALNGGAAANARAESKDLETAYTTLLTTCTEPATPATLTEAGNTPSSLSVAWEANGNPPDTIYKVEVQKQGAPTWTIVKNWSDGYTGLTASASGLETGANYYFKITATNRYSKGKNIDHFSVPLINTVPFVPYGGPVTGNLIRNIASGDSDSVEATIVGGNKVTLNVPRGTFSQAVTLSVATAPAIAACSAITPVYTITVSPALQPQLPVGVGLGVNFGQGAITNSKLVSITRYDPVKNKCIPIATNVDTANGMVYAAVNHFSSLVLQQVAPGGSLANVRLFPNPFHVRTQALLTIDGMPAISRVRIYTLHGEQIYDGNANASGVLSWPGNNKTGLQVSSGIYLVVVDSSNDRKTFKLAVVR